MCSTGGVQLICKQLSSLEKYDTLIVPSWNVEEVDIPDVILREVKRFFESNKRVLSFCSGAFLLGALGILKGRKAITHWRYADIFKQRFPDVEYVDDMLYYFDGQVACSAGSSAGIDLGLELIRHDFGNEAANKVARRLVVSSFRKGSQTQFSESPIQETRPQFSSVMDWAIKNLHKKIDIGILAEKAVMSRRSFDRKFKANFNITPKEWLTHQRLIRARSLLENHTYTVDKIAEMSGFESSMIFRHHFRKELGISPSS